MGTMHDFLASVARPWAEASLNPLTAKLRASAAEARAVLDLIQANPHEHGLEFPPEHLERIAREALPQARIYRPHPLGQPAARAAIAAWYARRGVSADPEEIVLVPGTSLAYLYLFRLLVEPGQEILVPRPGYPLFGDIAALAGVRQRYYHLGCDGTHWRLDFEDLEFQITPATRAVVAVAPHNPLGTTLDAAAWRRLGDVCTRHHLALVHDEVFAEFLTDPQAGLARPDAADFPLIASLNGFSKMYALPGMKVGWILLRGAAGARLRQALEYVSDTFLPVNEVAQAMVPGILSEGDAVSAALAEAYRGRRRVIAATLRFPTYEADGGVYLVGRLDGIDDDAFCERALDEAGVLVHPGHFYDLPSGHFVMTCVARAEVLRAGAEALNGLG